MALSFGSLFAGIGGFDLGLERVGMECHWQVEINPYCRRVLAKHWPLVSRYEDVRDVGVQQLQSVDVICGGFPCQDISYAGRGAGIGGERSGLWKEYARIAGELRPRYVAIENVPALRSRGLHVVLQDLMALGYVGEWHCIPAAYVGAPHRRDRLFIVAHDRRERVARIGEGEICRLGGFSWCEDVRGAADLRGRSDIPEPLVRRLGNGIPARVDRLRSLGNAIVPQVAEFIGRMILDLERQR